MSCHGWGVGMKCRAQVAFLAREKQMGGPDLVTQIFAGDEGTVTSVHSAIHMLYVLWQRLNRSLPVTEDQIQHLEPLS